MLLDDAHPRPQRHKCETPPDCDINDSDAAICTVHRAQNVQVLRQEKCAMKWLAEIVGKVDSPARVSCGFPPEDRFAQYLAQVRAIDLVDVKKVVTRRIRQGLGGGFHQKSWHRREPES